MMESTSIRRQRQVRVDMVYISVTISMPLGGAFLVFATEVSDIFTNYNLLLCRQTVLFSENCCGIRSQTLQHTTSILL